MEFGFKYRVKLADDSDVQSYLSEVTQGPEGVPNSLEMVDEEILIHSKASEIENLLNEGQNTTDIEQHGDTVPHAEVAEESQKPITIAQQILEKRIQDHLQEKLLYCPGSGGNAKDLSIDGIAVDLMSFREPDECMDAAQTSCTLTGKITIYQRFNNIHGSSLQSTQAGLSTLRIGMNEESAFVDEGDIFNEVEFLGGIIGIGRQGEGSPGGGRDISLNNGSAGVSAVILSSAHGFIDTHARKLSTTGQGIVGVFAMALLALVVARRKARNSNRGIGINEIAVDDLQSCSSQDDSWTEDGLGADDDSVQSERQPSEEVVHPSVEVYMKQEKKKNKFGFSKKRKWDHVSVAGM